MMRLATHRLWRIDATDKWPNAVSDKFPTLEEMQSAVGGYVEHVAVVNQEHNAQGHLFLNEDGKNNGLPLNIIATHIFHSGGGALDDYIVGNVLFWSGPIPREECQ